jgi:probable HAF family extracellular repeat protein
MRRLLWGLAALAVVALPVRAAAGYVVTDLGNFNAVALNASGQVAGTAVIANEGTYAVLYSGGVLTILGTLGGPTTSTTGARSSPTPPTATPTC